MPAWQTLPQFLRVELSSHVVAGYVDRLDEALDASRLHAEHGPTLVWRPAVFDRAAWHAINCEVDRVLDWIPWLERESVERVGRERKRLLPTAIGLACFRSPPS
jgi:hypothetical protein